MLKKAFLRELTQRVGGLFRQQTVQAIEHRHPDGRIVDKQAVLGPGGRLDDEEPPAADPPSANHFAARAPARRSAHARRRRGIE